jgi:uncharacterized protein (TIGR02246 family)
VLEASEEAAVRAVEAAYDRAWCAGDLDGLMGCLASDAVLVNPRGQVATGKAEARVLLGAFLAGAARGTGHQSTIERIFFVGDDVAVVDGRAIVTNRSAEADPIAQFEHAFTDVLVKGSDRWLIAHIRAYSLEDG